MSRPPRTPDQGHGSLGPLHLQSGPSERIAELSRMESTFLLSEALRREFQTRTYIPMSRLAELLPMDPKTLAEHGRKANIDWRRKGLGEKRPRRVFTQPDVVAFLQRIIAKSEASCLTDDPDKNVVPFPTRVSSAIPN